jgi:hypothetical protein
MYNKLCELFQISYRHTPYLPAITDTPEYWSLFDDEISKNIDYFETHLTKGTYFEWLPSHLQKHIFAMATKNYTIERFDNIYASNDTSFTPYEAVQ